MSQYWRPRTPTKRGVLDLPPVEAIRWSEASTARRRYSDRINDQLRAKGYTLLKPGVTVIYKRRPWILVDISERPDDLWGAEFEQAWTDHLDACERYRRGEKPDRATWPGRPLMIQLVPAGNRNAKPVHLAAPASYDWRVLPEHYAVCVACGEVPPCRHELAETEADRQMAVAEVRMGIPAGACMGCGEAITGRQKSQRFPGPNLWRPDLSDGSAVFHARQECAGDADRYAKQWRDRGGHNPQPSLFMDQPDGGQS
ncbi:hypothetical protein ACWGHA_11025 [Streptomyces xanthophaeus]